MANKTKDRSPEGIWPFLPKQMPLFHLILLLLFGDSQPRFPTFLPFQLIFSLGIGYRLPLHIGRGIFSAGTYGRYMVDYIARTLPTMLTSGRTCNLALKGGFGGVGAMNAGF